MSSVEGNSFPQGWEIKEIQEIASPNHSYAIGDGDHGQIKSSWYKEEGIPYIRVGDILDNGTISFKKMVYISEKVHNDNKKSHLLPGDLIIAKTGATIGKVAVIPESIPTSNTTASVGKITLNSQLAITKFVFYYLNSSDFKKDMWSVSHKSAQPGFNIKDLKSFKIPLPPIEEQKRIVDKIDALFAKIDKAISLTEESLKQAKNLLPSVLKEVFEKGKEDGWEEKKLEEVASYDKSKYKEHNRPYVGLEHIESNTSKFLGNKEPSNVKSSTFKFDERHVLYGRLRPYLNKVLIPDFKGHCSTEIFPILTNEKLIRKYLSYWLMSPVTNAKIDATWTGARMPRANMKEVIKFKLPIPAIETQKSIVNSLDKVSNQSKQTQSKLEEQLDYLKQLKSSILSKAFNGKS